MSCWAAKVESRKTKEGRKTSQARARLYRLLMGSVAAAESWPRLFCFTNISDVPSATCASTLEPG